MRCGSCPTARTTRSSSSVGDRRRHSLQGRSARAQADRAQSSLQRREVHPRARPRHRARPGRAAATSRIGIEDSGIGIPKDALRKLGRPFEQVESQLTKTHQGSGLGLAIAKSLVELHGGVMRIRSTSATARPSWCGCRSNRRAAAARGNRAGPTAASEADPSLQRDQYGALPRMRTKQRRTLRLRFRDMGLERGEIGHVGGARQQRQHARACRFGIELARTGRAAKSG